MVRLLLMLSMILGSGASARAQLGYTAAPDEAHYVLLLVDPDYGDVLELSAEVARYQLRYYKDAPLSYRAIRLLRRPERFAVQVTGFANEAAALRYTTLLEQRRPDFTRERMLRDYYPIGKTNFAVLYRAQSLPEYRAFARRRYTAE